MKHQFRLGPPEIVGFAVLGATAGAVLAGVGSAAGILPMLACVAGAILLPVLVIMPWQKLLRHRDDRLTAGGPN